MNAPTRNELEPKTGGSAGSDRDAAARPGRDASKVPGAEAEPGAARSGVNPGAARAGATVVISSVTGKPLAWPPKDEADSARRERRDPRDQDILRDVPPHWGTGR